MNLKWEQKFELWSEHWKFISTWFLALLSVRRLITFEIKPFIFHASIVQVSCWKWKNSLQLQPKILLIMMGKVDINMNFKWYLQPHFLHVFLQYMLTFFFKSAFDIFFLQFLLNAALQLLLHFDLNFEHGHCLLHW